MEHLQSYIFLKKIKNTCGVSAEGGAWAWPGLHLCDRWEERGRGQDFGSGKWEERGRGQDLVCVTGGIPSHVLSEEVAPVCCFLLMMTQKKC